MKCLSYRGFKGPFDGHLLPTDENAVSPQRAIGMNFSSLLEELSQSLLVIKLQAKPLVPESELLGKTGGRRLDLSTYTLLEYAQCQLFRCCSSNRNVIHF